jgi:hypothetical protein
VSLGPADKQDIEQSQKIIVAIMSKLKANDCINMNYNVDFQKLDKLLLYSDLCAFSLRDFESAITKNNYTNFEILKTDLARHNISQDAIMNIYVSLIFSQFLLLYAHLGNILVALLKGVNWHAKIITGTETLGNLVGVIKSITSIDLKESIVDTEFRNALGHGWYWVENNDIHYFTDGTLTSSISLRLGELYIKQRKLWHFVANWASIIDSGAY